MKRFIKPIIFCLLTMIILSFFTSCAYNPPVGYTEKHHNRDEILAFAHSIDPNATVSESYTDTQIDDWNRNLDFAYEELAKIPDLKVVGAAAEGGRVLTYTLDNLDRSKINLDTTAWGITAAELEEMLQRMDRYMEEFEASGVDHLTLEP